MCAGVSPWKKPLAFFFFFFQIYTDTSLLFSLPNRPTALMWSKQFFYKRNTTHWIHVLHDNLICRKPSEPMTRFQTRPEDPIKESSGHIFFIFLAIVKCVCVCVWCSYKIALYLFSHKSKKNLKSKILSTLFCFICLVQMFCFVLSVLLCLNCVISFKFDPRKNMHDVYVRNCPPESH